MRTKMQLYLAEVSIMKYIHYADVHNGTVRTIHNSHSLLKSHLHRSSADIGCMSFADCMVNITPVTRGLWRWNMNKKVGKWQGAKRADNPSYVEMPVPDAVDIALALNVMASVALAIKLSSVLAAIAAITCAAALVSKCKCDLSKEG